MSMPTLADEAYDRLEAMIVSLALPPGSIHSEADLSQQLGIGRTPVREALQRLALGRLVEALPRKGIRVSPIDIADHLALLETRRVLDALVTSRAAQRAHAQEREALFVIAREMQQAAEDNDLDTFLVLDHRGDALLEAACRNAYAAQALAPLHTHCRRFWYQHRHDADLLASAALHCNILRAVARGDAAEAETCTHTLLDYLVTRTRAAIDLY